ncbi:MAG: sensor histidine kinase [bacterium]|nr:sensor histidine kinase [bacterium]
MKGEQLAPTFKRPYVLVGTAGFFALACGATAMLGWAADVPRLIDWDGDGITIKFNPALAIALLGSALVCHTRFPQWQSLIRALAVLGALIGFATLLQHLTGLNFRIDNFFVTEAPGARATGSPGRMGAPASTSLTFLGIALFLSTTAYHRHASKAAIPALLYSSLSLVGYAFRADALFTLPRITGIALQTAVAIFTLSIGTIALHREVWPMSFIVGRDAGSRMFRAVFPLTIVVAVFASYLSLLGLDAGLYDTRFGAALQTLIEIIAFALVLGWAAGSLAHHEQEAVKMRQVRTENEARRRIASAQEAERRRLARDLHDHLGQQITSIRLRIRHFIHQTHQTHPHLAASLSEIEDVAEVLDGDVSLLAWELRPVSLDKDGLRSSVENFVEAWGKNYGVETEFYSPEAFPRFEPEVELNLYRIVQEALNNSLKHASAKRVSVSMVMVDNSIRIAVEDDGRGFDPNDAIHQSFGGGQGLSGMYERASLIGGKLEIDSSPDTGTTVYATIPIETSAAPMPPAIRREQDIEKTS